MNHPRPRRYDLIAFDWDGTLFDSTALIVRAIRAAFADVGAPVPEPAVAAEVIGLSLPVALARAMPGLEPALYERVAQRYRHHWFASQHEVVLFDGVAELLQALKARNFWLAVATGKSRRGLDEALHSVGLTPVFDATRTADETASKPHPRMLQELMREFGTEPERTLMIGDTTHDLQLAANAGCDALAVSYGAHEVASFEGHAPRAVLHSVAELSDWLAAHA
ncbi:MAG: hypothetical protein RLY78_2472 [Pseudomonadota bacterium]|jgi:phosphoglycolate phosphatase|uniref:HAD-IA family hydrolase n=1 Tax=Pseudaquabacterium rugosum TaxID=2984194 RepID=A0ABU9B5G7_9BURK